MDDRGRLLSQSRGMDDRVWAVEQPARHRGGAYRKAHISAEAGADPRLFPRWWAARVRGVRAEAFRGTRASADRRDRARRQAGGAQGTLRTWQFAQRHRGRLRLGGLGERMAKRAVATPRRLRRR